MIPFFKVFALTTRVFSRPLLMYIKSYHKSNKELMDSFMARPFITIGNWQYHASMFINRKLLGVETDTDMFVRPLNVEIALEQGMELFYEIVLYVFILGICVYEIRKYTIEGQISKEKDRKNVLRIEQKLDSWLLKQMEQEKKILAIRQKIEEVNRVSLMGNSLMSRLFWHDQVKSQTSLKDILN